MRVACSTCAVCAPLKWDGKAVGAIDVSGGSGEQDQAMAAAGAAGFA
jgi:uncharacterized protein GlcG (DUF336 family)